MGLNEAGKIANDEWIKTCEIRPNVQLGEFVIMPKHLHGIIRLMGRGFLHLVNDVLHSPENKMHKMDSHDNNNATQNNNKGECNSPLRGPSNSIGAIIRGYKSSVTKQLTLMNIG